MNHFLKKALATFGVIAVSVSFIAAYNVQAKGNSFNQATTLTTKDSTTTQNIKTPKYIFLFIGDGMSYPQIQSASYYLGANESNGGVQTQKLSFMNFPVAGSAQTYDSTSFCPDSASTATSISTGNKTYSGTINMDTSKTVKYETIAEQLKEQLGYKIGILTTVNLNHATPAAFYAHQASRSNYYEIGQEMIASNFDYFAGGALLKPTGKNEDKTSIYDLAKASGYKVITTQKEAENLTATDGKAIVIAEQLADSDSLSYSIDAESNEWTLSDYVAKGIEVLDNEKGFFMMVEGGKIDWACHANDAGSSINDTIALSSAVDEAIKFYNEHPDETLILVTGDHETGGLTIGYAGTNYDTYLTNLNNQKISYAKFDSNYVANYKANQTDFNDVLKDIKKEFGLLTSNDQEALLAKNANLVLTDYELNQLMKAYERTLTKGTSKQNEMTQEEYALYGTYEPLTVTITHLLNNKSGISFSSYSHTGLPVPVFAVGVGSELFEGYYDNTDIYNNLATLTKVK
ncbi:MAG: alkaline phosphatase [Candidatus Cellulosilyticum pullistercoris]|uniref:Alkaline phosphatase n=1 Tax=Candidatus Cellulosilyticum pullistercoris TaxID=2838521 RepID=A0A9E2K980_9FIRM|nr:alkaline phosphatase [Candidatus Cellulosilyticum pullistercoris]